MLDFSECPAVAACRDAHPVTFETAEDACELLTAVSYVGIQAGDGHARGQRLAALFACMYFAALRPAEAVALRRQDCFLPETGWGRLTLEKSRPEVNRRWADIASAHEERGLKHRPATETRTVPIPRAGEQLLLRSAMCGPRPGLVRQRRSRWFRASGATV
jgi:integrase